ncbi:tetratricopeptide repeat protein [Jejudonia soesokkakensis]|uniref:Tetratricopeptide repeat protein n=1 Tax=Jejudonia soesokkakensis TaxID=1323432 RepID=A0ABW2MRZ3_9FLAO
MNKLFIFLLFGFIVQAGAQNASALQLADSLYALGNYNQAILHYKTAGNSATVYNKLAKAYEAAGNTSEALTYYKKSLGLNHKATITAYHYAKLLTEAGRLEAADSLFNTLIEANPNNANFVYELGQVKEKRNDSTAINSYNFAYALDSSHLNTLYKLARHHTVKRNFSSALKFIDQGLAIDSKSNRFITLRALVAFYYKNYHEAVKNFELLLAANQSNEQLHENLAISYAQTNQFEKAIEQYTILINDYNDKIPSYHFNLAKAYQAIRYFDKAIRHTEIAIVLQDVTLEREYLQLANIYKKQGNSKLVFEMMGKAVAENPESEILQYQRAIAADNYFKDRQSIIDFYEGYLNKFGDNASYSDLAKQRISDLKKEIHFEKD